MKIAKDSLERIKNDRKYSMYSVEELTQFPQVKRGDTIVTKYGTYIALEPCRVNTASKEADEVYELGCIDDEYNFVIIGGPAGNYIKDLEKVQSSPYMMKKFDIVTRLTVLERFKTKDIVKVTIVESSNSDSKAGREEGGVVCLLSRTAKVKPGEVWSCSVIKVRDRYLYVKEGELLQTMEQSEESLSNKLKDFADTINSNMSNRKPNKRR